MHPHLVLQGKAARGVAFVESGKASNLESIRTCLHVTAGFDLNAEMVQRTVNSTAALGLGYLDEYQLQGRRGDREVRVAGAALMGLNTKQR